MIKQSTEFSRICNAFWSMTVRTAEYLYHTFYKEKIKKRTEPMAMEI